MSSSSLCPLYTLGLNAQKYITYVPEQTFGSISGSTSRVVKELCEITKCVLRPVSGLSSSSERFFKKRMLYKRMDYLSQQVQQSSSSSTQEILELLSKIKIAVEFCLKTDSQSLIFTNKIYEYTLLISPLVKEIAFVPQSQPKRQQKVIDEMVEDLWAMIAIISIPSYDDSQKVERFKNKIAKLYERAEDNLCEPFFWKMMEWLSQIETVFSKSVGGYGNSVMIEKPMIDLDTETGVKNTSTSLGLIQSNPLNPPFIPMAPQAEIEPINLLKEKSVPSKTTEDPVKKSAAKKPLKAKHKRKISIPTNIPKDQAIASWLLVAISNNKSSLSSCSAKQIESGGSIVIRPMVVVSSEWEAQKQLGENETLLKIPMSVITSQSLSSETSSQSSSDKLSEKTPDLSPVHASAKKTKKVFSKSQKSNDKSGKTSDLSLLHPSTKKTKKVFSKSGKSKDETENVATSKRTLKDFDDSLLLLSVSLGQGSLTTKQSSEKTLEHPSPVPLFGSVMNGLPESSMAARIRAELGGLT